MSTTTPAAETSLAWSEEDLFCFAFFLKSETCAVAGVVIGSLVLLALLVLLIVFLVRRRKQTRAGVAMVGSSAGAAPLDDLPDEVYTDFL